MKLELSPTHPMHKGLCRGHGGSVWLVWCEYGLEKMSRC